MNIGRKIADARISANITQQELADKLFISRELISKWENGSRRPDFETVCQIAKALSISPDSIVRKEDRVFEELEDCVPYECCITRERLSALIGSFISKLPQPDAGLFLQRYYQLDSYSEIAKLFGMSESKVRSRLSRTVRKLKAFLKEECKNE
ncbi:MAG: helix-turn-helix domain-containing protein [Clostridia bacterium]|nr:helix-turn-helix domain-containing protein [Clostridia bacterium]